MWRCGPRKGRERWSLCLAALRVSEDIAAIAEAAQVVVAAPVRVPDVDERACDRLAARRQDLSGEPHLWGGLSWLDERGTLRRLGFVKRSGGLLWMIPGGKRGPR
jgi:hypothetical protein